MVNILTLFLITAAVGLISFLIFSLTVKQSTVPIKISIEESYLEVVLVIKKIQVDFAHHRFLGALVLIFSLFNWYFKMKYRNFFGRLDAVLVQGLIAVMLAMTAFDAWNFVNNVFDWLKETKLLKKF